MTKETSLDKAACNDWTKIPVHCAECGVQFLRKVKHQKYCDGHRHLAGAVIRPQEAPSSNLVAISDVVADIELRFTSGNSIPVERAHVKANEWRTIKSALRARNSADETAVPLTPSTLDGLLAEADKYILPVDVKIGAATFRKGVKVGTMLRGLKSHAERQTATAYSPEEPSRDDARDAARYRWLRQARGVYDDTGRFPQGEDLDECCDAFMAKQGSSEVKPTAECNHPRSELLARKGDAFEMRKCHDCMKIFRVRLPEKAPVKAGDPCPTFDSTVHEAHNGKCMYCGAPMAPVKAAEPEALTEAEQLLQAWADLLPPNGNLYWVHIEKARDYFKRRSAKEPTRELTLIDFGYAPGNYTFTCHDCWQESTGDKRAIRCEVCATQALRENRRGAEKVEEPAAEKATRPLPDHLKAPVAAGGPCPAVEDVHTEHNGKCMYCGAPMAPVKAAEPEALTEAEQLLQAWADLLPPNGNLYWVHIEKARDYFKRRSAKETSAPLPPEVLANALQDVVHVDDGPVRAGRSVKATDEVRATYNATVDDLNEEQCASIGHEFRPIDSSGQVVCIFCNRRPENGDGYQ